MLGQRRRLRRTLRHHWVEVLCLLGAPGMNSIYTNALNNVHFVHLYTYFFQTRLEQNTIYKILIQIQNNN